MEQTKKSGGMWLIGAVVIVVVIAAYCVSTYNKAVGLEEGIMNSWGNVETQCQRRLDLIPNLVTAVKAYALHERETFEEVVEARAKATQVTIDPSRLDEESIRRFEAVQSQLSGALSRLLAVSEAYPELKASENFLVLQSQLEGTENRIAVARREFNKQVNAYNGYVRTFPANMVTRLLGFEKKDYFAAEAGAERAVQVEM